MLPKARAYVKSYDDQTQWMYFLIEDVSLLEKYNTICDKVSANIKKWFDSELVDNKKFLKTKIKSYGDVEIHDKEMPKAGSILVSSNHDWFCSEERWKYYPEVFLKECKYIEKEVIRHIIGGPEISSDEPDE